MLRHRPWTGPSVVQYARLHGDRVHDLITPVFYPVVQDESAREGGCRGKPLMNADVNGNPLDRQSYLRMRQPPRLHENSSIGSGSQERGACAIANDDVGGRRGDLHEMGNKSEDCSNPANSTNGSKKGKKQRKVEEKICAESCQNYVGDIKEVDTLVKFINNNIDPKELREIKQSASVEGSDGAKSATSKKNQKKSKDRIKTKQLLTTGVGESSVDCLTPASETTQLLSTTSLSSYSSISEHKPPVHKRKANDKQAVGFPGAEELAKEMGNSSEKSGDDMDTGARGKGPVQNHTKSEDTVIAKTNKDMKTEPQKNHVLSGDKMPVGNPKQPGEIKDKTRVKTSCRDSQKKDAHGADNNVNKTSKSEPPKTDVKAEALSKEVPSVDSEKEGQSSASKDITKSEDSHKPDTASLPVLMNHEATIDDDFIFTNIPVNVQEQEFTVVSKKKKRTPASAMSQDQPVSSQSTSHHYSSKDVHQPSFVSYNKPGNWENSNRRFPSRPYSTVSARPAIPAVTGSESREKIQDFSHSAFPALNPADRDSSMIKLLGPEARSLEDLPSGVGQHSSDKDSDKASTKSLPAVKALRGRGVVNYPVSYATMASSRTPRESVDSSKAESVSSSMGDGNMEELPMTPTSAMKWKGSPQERRHSIGSAPEELSKASSSSNLQRTGSQEMICRDKDAPDKSTASLPGSMTLPGVKGMVQSNSAGSFAGSEADSARGSEAGSEVAGEVFAASVLNTTAENRKAVLEDQTKTLSVSHTITIPSSCSACPSSQAVTVTNTATVVTSACSQPSVSFMSESGSKPRAASGPPRSQPNPAVSQCKNKITNTVNNGHKLKKSVIFCNGIHYDSKHCDVTFGDKPIFCVDEERDGSACELKSSGAELFTSTVTSSADKGSVSSQPLSNNVDSKSKQCSNHAASSTDLTKGEDNPKAKCQAHLISKSSSTSGDAITSARPNSNDAAVSAKDSSGMETSSSQSIPSTSSGDVSVASVSSGKNPVTKQAKGPHIMRLNGVVSVQGVITQHTVAPVIFDSSAIQTNVVSHPSPVIPTQQQPTSQVSSTGAKQEDKTIASVPVDGNGTSLPSDQPAAAAGPDSSPVLPSEMGESIPFTYGDSIPGGKPRTAVFLPVAEVYPPARLQSLQDFSSFLAEQALEQKNLEIYEVPNNQ